MSVEVGKREILAVDTNSCIPGMPNGAKDANVPDVQAPALIVAKTKARPLGKWPQNVCADIYNSFNPFFKKSI